MCFQFKERVLDLERECEILKDSNEKLVARFVYKFCKRFFRVPTFQIFRQLCISNFFSVVLIKRQLHVRDHVYKSCCATGC